MQFFRLPAFFLLLSLLLYPVLITASEGGPDKQYKILFLGDEYTAGHGVSQSATWPLQVIKLLLQNEKHARPPVIIAQKGWTAFDLYKAIEKADLKPEFDAVFVLTGYNDMQKGRSVSSYRATLKLIIKKAAYFAGNRQSRVYLISIPDWSATPRGAQQGAARIRARVESYNDICHGEAKIVGCSYLDITVQSRRGLEHEEYLQADGLSPSALMHRDWAAYIVRKVFPLEK